MIYYFAASFTRSCNEHLIRLAGGPSPLEGRVEVCVNGDWGAVNDRIWDYRQAIVACRQLGFSPLGNTVEPLIKDNPLSEVPLYYLVVGTTSQ